MIKIIITVQRWLVSKVPLTDPKKIYVLHSSCARGFYQKTLEFHQKNCAILLKTNSNVYIVWFRCKSTTYGSKISFDRREDAAKQEIISIDPFFVVRVLFRQLIYNWKPFYSNLPSLSTLTSVTNLRPVENIGDLNKI